MMLFVLWQFIYNWCCRCVCGTLVVALAAEYGPLYFNTWQLYVCSVVYMYRCIWLIRSLIICSCTCSRKTSPPLYCSSTSKMLILFRLRSWSLTCSASSRKACCVTSTYSTTSRSWWTSCARRTSRCAGWCCTMRRCRTAPTATSAVVRSASRCYRTVRTTRRRSSDSCSTPASLSSSWRRYESAICACFISSFVIDFKNL